MKTWVRCVSIYIFFLNFFSSLNPPLNPFHWSFFYASRPLPPIISLSLSLSLAASLPFPTWLSKWKFTALCYLVVCVPRAPLTLSVQSRPPPPTTISSTSTPWPLLPPPTFTCWPWNESRTFSQLWIHDLMAPTWFGERTSHWTGFYLVFTGFSLGVIMFHRVFFNLVVLDCTGCCR